MTQKELRKLKKTELLEMMIALRNELDRVQAERDALQEQLQYYKAGEKVKITIQTQNKNGEYEKKDVEVTLGKQSE